MRCRACNVILTNEEESLTYEHGQRIELCTHCLRDSEVGVFFSEEDDELFFSDEVNYDI